MRRTKAVVTIFFFLLLFLIPSTGHGLDTDLYALSGVNIPPNVLIILDSSASMSEVSSGQLYDPALDYSAYVPPTGTAYTRNQVYMKSSGSNWVKVTIPSDCSALQSLLDTYGEAINFSGCIYNKKDFQIGNFRNYLQATGGPGGNRSRFGLATGIIHSYINTVSGVRFAVMTFNRAVNKDDNTLTYTVRNSNGTEYVFNDSRDNNIDAIGGYLLGYSGGRPGFVDENKNGKTDVFNDLAVLKNDSYSPLAETLYEAGAVFQNITSDITGTSYTAGPKLVQYSCQKNYVLIISDGAPTKDSDSRLKDKVGITDSNGNGWVLDEVSRYLYNLDLNKDTKPHTKQNIKTYTVGFSMGGSAESKLLEDTVKNIEGKYYYVWSSQSFNIAFQSFIAEVLNESVSYVAPVVPISQMERTSAGNQMYLAMFKPTMKSFWKGNIKKYCIATKNSSGDIVDCKGNAVSYTISIYDKSGTKIGERGPQVGDILDANGSPVMDDKTNGIKSTARSFWSSETDPADGADTEAGGVGKKLQAMDLTKRKVYTYFGTNDDLTDSSNAFSTTNAAITATRLGLTAGDDVGRTSLIKFVQGYDAYFQNEDPNKQGPTYNRDWNLGAFIHSRPVVIHYADKTVIYAGANDGMLHAFDDQTGEELWAFVPPNLLPISPGPSDQVLKNLNGEAIQFFVDGPPKAYVQRDSSNNIISATLIFGERRGGNHYIALDIKYPESPKFLWQISPSGITYKTTVTNTTAYQEMGQTWGAPQVGKIKGNKWVAFISGGYDENQDNQPVVLNDTKGRAVYVVDISNGNLVWSYSYGKDANMKYCIPSDIARVDTDGDSYVDRLYVGDIGGQIWRFDIGDSDPTKWTAKIIFDANKGESLKRKIFYPPDVTLERGNYEMIFFGTGDREHPKDTTRVDKLYAVKDKNPSSTLSGSDLVDVTQDLLQEGTDSQKTTTLNSLQTQSGWFIALNQNLGEKCLSNSVLFYGAIYYTTFTPVFGDKSDPCFLDQGIARIYALNYLTGNAVFDLDGSGSLSDLTRSDRSAEIGASIPSGVIVTFVGGTTVAYGGVGGGVYRPPLPSTRTIIPINWRIVF